MEEEAKECSIYPNPISRTGMLNVHYFVEQVNNEFEILDIHSIVFLRVKRDLSTGAWHTIQIDVSDLSEGTYILIDHEGDINHSLNFSVL